MAVKCKNGHWYDPNVFRSCPHCKKKNETLSLMVDNVEEDDKTVSIMDADLSLGEQLGEIVQENIGVKYRWMHLVNFRMMTKPFSFGFFGMAGVQPGDRMAGMSDGGGERKRLQTSCRKKFYWKKQYDGCCVD